MAAGKDDCKKLDFPSGGGGALGGGGGLGATQEMAMLRRIDPDTWLNIPPPILKATQIFRDELLRAYVICNKTQEQVTNTSKDIVATCQRLEMELNTELETSRNENTKRFRDIEQGIKYLKQDFFDKI